MLKKMRFDPSWNWGTILLFLGLVFQTGIMYSRIMSLEAVTIRLQTQLSDWNNENTVAHGAIIRNLASSETKIDMHIRQTNGRPN